MKHLLSLCLLSATTLLGQRAETIFFRAAMLPSNEVPAVDIVASGTATIRAHVMRNAAGEVVSGTVDFIINYTFPGAMEFTGLHIHRGAAGENGPVVINTGIGGGAASVSDPAGKGIIDRPAQVRPADGPAVAALRDMLDNPAGFYVNIHSTVNPGGVIRGQLQKPDIATYMSIMSPSNEVPAITGQNASGMSTITVMRTFDDAGKMNTGLVIFEASYSFDRQVTMSGYHIHSSPAGVNGPVVINTGVTSLQSTPTGSGTLLFPVEVDTSRQNNVDVMNGLFTDPGNFYANIHTTEFPGGVIRGQLRRTDENFFPVNMLPSNEVPPVDISASAPANVKVNTVRNADGEIMAGKVVFDANYRFPDTVTFTGFHIHNEVAGQNGPVIINTGLTAGAPEISVSGFGNIYIPVLVTSVTGLATLNSMIASPEKHYVNLHSTVSPGGVVRAQMGSQFASAPAIGYVSNSVLSSGQTNVAPGGWMSIFGDRFAHVSSDYTAWEGVTLPSALNGAEVTVGGLRAPVFRTAGTRIDVQVPYETTTGTQPVTVKNAVGESAAFPVNVERYAPAIWLIGEDQGQIVKASNLTFVGPDNPIQAGDILVVFCTGLNNTTPALRTGQIVPEALFETVAVTSTIGGRPGITAANLAYPGVPGTYAVGIIVPPGVPAGMQPLQLTAGGQASNQVMVPVR